MFRVYRNKSTSLTAKRSAAYFRPLRLEALEHRDLLSFVVGPTFVAGATPVALAAVDIDVNGTTDLAVVNAVPNGTVTVLRGTGTGVFRPAFRGKAGPLPYDLAVGDFNLDGTPDLATVNYQDDAVTVLTGSGGGITFVESYPTEQNPFYVAVGDFNEDSAPDLAVTHNVANGTVEIFLGAGNNEFTPALVLDAGFNSTAVAVGDVNKDGHQDLAVGSYHVGEVQVFLGRGDGSFLLPIVLPVGPSIDDLTIIDVDHDDNLDIIALNGEPAGGITVLLGNGDGTFRDEFGKQLGNAGHPRALVTGDFNQDGHIDVAIAGHDNVAVSVLLGNGDGRFQSPLTYPLPSAPRDIVAGDFDNDGFVDLAVAAPALGVTILRNAADWTPVPPTEPKPTASVRPRPSPAPAVRSDPSVTKLNSDADVQIYANYLRGNAEGQILLGESNSARGIDLDRTGIRYGADATNSANLLALQLLQAQDTGFCGQLLT